MSNDCNIGSCIIEFIIIFLLLNILIGTGIVSSNTLFIVMITLALIALGLGLGKNLSSYTCNHCELENSTRRENIVSGMIYIVVLIAIAIVSIRFIYLILG